MADSVQTAVERLIDAQAGHRPLIPLSETDRGLTLERAYVVQDALRSELNRRGQRSIGWKLGATSPSGQAASGVTEPLSGFLMSRQRVDGAEVSASEFVSLSVEAEVAFRMRSRLAGDVTVGATKLAIEGAVASLEIGDFIFSGKPAVTDIVASSIFANAIVLGGPLMPLSAFDVSREQVMLEHNGIIVGTYTSAEVMGNPLNALVWLAKHLATRGLALEPGDIVISGAISKVLRPKVGDSIRALFEHLGSVSIKVVT